MKTLLEISAMKHLSDLTELVEMTDTGDVEYTELREEKEHLEVSLSNPIVSLSEALKKSSLTYGVRGKSVSVVRSPRVTKIYFDVKSSEQAKGFGMKSDKGEWYLNVWSSNVMSNDLTMHIKGLGIPFVMTRYNAFGGRNRV